MLPRRSITFAILSAAILLASLSTFSASAQSAQFTYQGLLNDGGSPANGTYDLQFRLFDALAGGTQVGSTLIREDVAVTSGLFKVVLDFGTAAFPGADRFLEIGVRPGASTGAFTALSPLQQLNATPYAVRSLSAATAAAAATAATADGLSAACVNCVTSGQISTVQGSQVTGNIAGSQITGAIPVGSVPAGSAAYVQNTSTLQAGANFNISGSGTAGGTLSANLVNTATQYNLGGNRVLFASGFNNVFAGIGAGINNTTGLGNAFFGGDAGRANTTGDNNSFFGRLAGPVNTAGFNNSFFGSGAGAANTTASWNSFFGHNAGTSTITGNFNAFFGDSAGFANTTGAYNSFFGAQAGQNNNQGYDNVFIGDLAGITNTTGNNNTLIGDSTNVTAPSLTYATALGAEATVSTSNTIVLGRSSGADKVVIPGLGAAGATALCRNASNEISTCSSSQRYKDHILAFRAGLNVIQRLQPVTFHWKASGARDLGLIAEEVAKVDPLLVTYNEKGQIEGVKYQQLNVVLINALQQQQAQLEQQQEQIQQQQAEIEALKRLVCLTHPQAAACQKQKAQR